MLCRFRKCSEDQIQYVVKHDRSSCLEGGRKRPLWGGDTREIQVRATPAEGRVAKEPGSGIDLAYGSANMVAEGGRVESRRGTEGGAIICFTKVSLAGKRESQATSKQPCEGPEERQQWRGWTVQWRCWGPVILEVELEAEQRERLMGLRRATKDSCS